jgi:hypothetical protein
MSYPQANTGLTGMMPDDGRGSSYYNRDGIPDDYNRASEYSVIDQVRDQSIYGR